MLARPGTLLLRTAPGQEGSRLVLYSCQHGFLSWKVPWNQTSQFITLAPIANVVAVEIVELTVPSTQNSGHTSKNPVHLRKPPTEDFDPEPEQNRKIGLGMTSCSRLADRSACVMMSSSNGKEDVEFVVGRKVIDQGPPASASVAGSSPNHSCAMPRENGWRVVNKIWGSNPRAMASRAD